MRKQKYFLFILLLIALIGTVVISGCGRKGNVAADTHAKVTYRCPMHPTYTSDKPGDCPICGMKLVKVKSSSKADPTPAAPAAASKEKNLEEVCVEHSCTMKGCTMNVKADIKPGERVLCPVCGEVISTANGKVVEIIASPAAPGKKERKLLYYRNPMNSQATSPVPMKDSMGMDYVPVYEGVPSEGQGPTVMISPERQQLIGVKTDTVKKINLEKIVRASGKIAYDPQLAVTQEEFIQALANEYNTKDSPLKDVADRAKALTGAARQKLKLLGMNDEQIAEVEKTKKVQTGLYLPSNGEPVWAYVSIYEYEIGLVKVGDSVDLEAVAYPGETFKGVVISINPVLDAATRTNQVRVQVPNPENKLKPEMFVNAKIRVSLGEKLAVPEAAVLDTGLRKVVYLSKSENLLESREVKLGQKAGAYYEVIDGLMEGDVVVTSGNFLVDSESKLKAGAQ